MASHEIHLLVYNFDNDFLDVVLDVPAKATFKSVARLFNPKWSSDRLKALKFYVPFLLILKIHVANARWVPSCEPHGIRIQRLFPESLLDLKLMREIDKANELIRPRPSPSAMGSSDSDVMKAAQDDGEDDAFVTGRPFTNRGLPNTFFASSLATLSKELKASSITHAERQALVLLCRRFMDLCCAFYDSEDLRLNAVGCSLTHDIFPDDPKYKIDTPGAQASSGTDFRWYLSLDGQEIDYTTLKLKNQRGGGDPRMQAQTRFRDLILLKGIERRTNFPGLILTLAASRLDIDTSIFTDRMYYEHVLTIDLEVPFCAEDHIDRFVEVVYALRKCTQGLKQHYQTALQQSVDPIAPFLPTPTGLSAEAVSLLNNLKFVNRLDHDGGILTVTVDKCSRAGPIFLATLDGRRVLTKFVAQDKEAARYSETAHRLLADADRAPPLHGVVPIVGGYLVVMGYAEGAHTLLYGKPAGSAKAVKDALQRLHGAGIVFGDLREQNVLHVPATDGQLARTWLIDFDWAGKAHEAVYPAMMNDRLDIWPAGVAPGAYMEIEHDRELFRRMFPEAVDLHTGW
ncbi:uncharacterized protein BXZ73DRAFT_103570 [Epithele typhae]|uniref:uncharacterized protein n=1 Tax=Epithele typhae TaxID=378194 RepID=UPI002007D0A4|nr:uncharacterized protein BXZ73DRAFT_103570 [Epithele typhae]KAH9924280.1 hypothetical protein BXZ73DRAFT_103570 [Epithele typhae]